MKTLHDLAEQMYTDIPCDSFGNVSGAPLVYYESFSSHAKKKGQMIACGVGIITNIHKYSDSKQINVAVTDIFTAEDCDILLFSPIFEDVLILLEPV